MAVSIALNYRVAVIAGTFNVSAIAWRDVGAPSSYPTGLLVYRCGMRNTSRNRL